ncbi:bifunctional 5,10-methylenetetrahydrofolate dehydrogenase/5,10-methenyltetrahydrofolate cyclohydrolase [candidate division TA06 bacterium]|uniref:Bifunctional protein FolD n=1 Tax=candidate division TA06 bacterium TaxID=2250710 RepID=A0A933IAT9_UNCT6|nr:bifunctional 5,10-methylenetetrahydrofolate dehydrogenase/5,10-methenyltetrahydrofolate cyclohydrolase [candidate division TA06 bacterium]
MAIIIDGKKIAADIRHEVAAEVSALKGQGTEPHLAVIIVGSDPASQVYVRNKHQDCEEVGICSSVIELPADTTQAQLLDKIKELNNDKTVHGILVQSPLPKGLSEEQAFQSISPLKDVDCFHPENVGLMTLGRPRFLPCTPAGVIELLVRTGIEISGKYIVIVGRSNIVGKPLANMLLQKAKNGNATVTVCHTGTKGLAYYTKQADIVIAAAGSPGMITGSMLNNNCVVIDVGVNQVADLSKKSGVRLTGDVDFESASKIASYITPVPGGVGPMTRAMLLKNTVKAAGLNRLKSKH